MSEKEQKNFGTSVNNDVDKSPDTADVLLLAAFIFLIFVLLIWLIGYARFTDVSINHPYCTLLLACVICMIIEGATLMMPIMWKPAMQGKFSWDVVKECFKFRSPKKTILLIMTTLIPAMVISYALFFNNKTLRKINTISHFAQEKLFIVPVDSFSLFTSEEEEKYNGYEKLKIAFERSRKAFFFTPIMLDRTLKFYVNDCEYRYKVTGVLNFDGENFRVIDPTFDESSFSEYRHFLINAINQQRSIRVYTRAYTEYIASKAAGIGVILTFILSFAGVSFIPVLSYLFYLVTWADFNLTGVYYERYEVYFACTLLAMAIVISVKIAAALATICQQQECKKEKETGITKVTCEHIKT